MNVERVSKILKLLQTIRLVSGNEFSAKKLGNAAKDINRFEDINLDNYIELNVGDKILFYVKSILEADDSITGIEELDKLSDEEYEKYYILSDFIEIKGIGIKKALKYYNEGKRSIEDLNLNSSGISKITRSTIEHSNDLKKRIKRSVIDIWINKFNDIISEFNLKYNLKLFFSPAGSYSRGADYSGDIDVILCSDIVNEPKKYFPEILQKMQDIGIIIGKTSLGLKKFEGKGFVEDEPIFQVDIEIVNTLDEYFYEILYFTGPANFNIKMRAKAKELGYNLTNHEMTDSNGNNIIVNSENEIFEILGFKYLEPHERI